MRSQRDEYAEVTDGRSVTISTGGAAHDLALGTSFPPLEKVTLTLSTVSKWRRVLDEGTVYYIPMWN